MPDSGSVPVPQTLLGKACALLSSSLDYSATLSSVAQLLVPQLADWCVIYVLTDEGVRSMGVAHADPAKGGLLRRFYLCDRADVNPNTPALHVIQTGQSLMSNDIADEALRAGSQSEEHFHFLRDVVGVKAGIVVPMRCRGRVLGAICLQLGGSGRRYDLGDLRQAEELAGLAALAVDNARLYSEAQQAIQDREEFLSIASHEIRAPMSTLQLQIELANHPAQQQAGLAAEQLQRMYRQVGRMRQLIDKLFDVTLIRAGHLDLQYEMMDLGSTVREVLLPMEGEFANAGCALLLRADAPAIGAWDRMRVEQVVTNLLSNALKYGAGKPIEVMVEPVPAAHVARLTVTDHGVGIAPESQARIFDRFDRGAADRSYQGLGLGLYIVRKILDALHGTIRVVSQPGRGASFIVELPLRK